MKISTVLFSICLVVSGSLRGAEDVSLESAFATFPKGCIVVYDTATDAYVRYNEGQCSERFLPASTFKVIHSMIALETGVASGPDFKLEWDGVVRSVPQWNGDQTLRSAVRYSVVWYFEQIAAAIGKERMADWVKLADYGNGDTSGTMPFWLRGNIAISAEEQVDFLRRFQSGDLPFSQETLDTVKELLFLEKRGQRTLYGKSGWVVAEGLNIGWFVGWVETPSGKVFFALNLLSETEEGFVAARKEIALRCLSRLGFWE